MFGTVVRVVVHKSRRIGLHSGNFLKTGFNDECSFRVIDCLLEYFDFSSL